MPLAVSNDATRTSDVASTRNHCDRTVVQRVLQGRRRVAAGTIKPVFIGCCWCTVVGLLVPLAVSNYATRTSDVTLNRCLVLPLERRVVAGMIMPVIILLLVVGGFTEGYTAAAATALLHRRNLLPQR